ncbi:MAG: M20/M25/M40 family metallo-hydrolase [Anaerolineales bacterium]|nr:M20/M25/M40 family metallo-hydrolase [Anaerolineales bacterium]
MFVREGDKDKTEKKVDVVSELNITFFDQSLGSIKESDIMPLKFDSKQAYNHIEYLAANIGPRLPGTDADWRAGDYIRSYLIGLGLSVTDQEFSAETTRLISHKMEILDPSRIEFFGRPVLGTPDTPEEGIEGEIVWVEGSKYQVGSRIAGKIVFLTPTDTMDFWKGFRAVLEYCPKAVVVIWPLYGVGPKHLQFSENVSKPFNAVTTFCITWEEGLCLFRSSAKRARLYLHTKRQAATTRNIIAEFQGSSRPDEIIVIGSHYDTMPDIPGAIDNASGVAVMMELANLFSQKGSKRTMRFVAWGGEEMGLLGSLKYVEQLRKQDEKSRVAQGFVEGRDKSDLEKHLLCINFDVLGMPLCYNGCYVHGAPEITAVIKTLSKELGIPHNFKEEIYGSDGEAFVWAGIPSITFTREGVAANFIHTIQDSLDIVSVEQLQIIGNLVDTFITQSVAEAVVWPFDRKIPDEIGKKVKDMLISYGFID